MQTRSAAATLGVLLAAVPASQATAQTPAPTLQFDRACYTEHMPAVFTGAGYTPGGEVNLVFSSMPMRVRGVYATRAGADGSLNGSATFPDEDDFLDDAETRETLHVSANDRARMDAGAPPESQFATASLTYTRWMGFSPARFVPGRRARVEISGWAFAAGETAWLQFRKGARAVSSVRIGQLEGDCGDRKARVKVPRSLAPGRYRVVFSTQRRGLSERYTWRNARVAGRRAASAAAAGPMTRARAAS
jgi:hypothetical protein